MPFLRCVHDPSRRGDRWVLGSRLSNTYDTWGEGERKGAKEKGERRREKGKEKGRRRLDTPVQDILSQASFPCILFLFPR